MIIGRRGRGECVKYPGRWGPVKLFSKQRKLFAGDEWTRIDCVEFIRGRGFHRDENMRNEPVLVKVSVGTKGKSWEKICGKTDRERKNMWYKKAELDYNDRDNNMKI